MKLLQINKKMNDISGEKFGRLTAIKPCGKNKWKNIMWLCKCDCGKEHMATEGKLKQGKVRSCGCLAKEMHIKQLETHGLTTGGKPRTFIIWNGMKARCLNPKNDSYKSYGARGIKICDEWMKFENFHNWAIANGYNDNLSLDRIDNDDDYKPSNCQWVTPSENYKKQRKARYITIDGVTLNVSDWCKYLKVSRYTAYKYLNVSEEAFVEKFSEKVKYIKNKKLLEELENK